MSTGLLRTLFVAGAIGVAVSAAAQQPARPLDVNPRILTSVDVTAEPAHGSVTDSPSGPSISWSLLDERKLQSLVAGLSSTRKMRTLDAAVGVALVAIGTRDRSLPQSAIYVGVHALRLGMSRDLPGVLKSYSIEPTAERGGFSIMVTRK